MRLKASIIIALALLGTMLLGSTSTEAGGGGCHESVLNDESGASVDLKGACFLPTVIRVQPGNQIRWTNRDATAHTVTGVAGSWGNYDQLAQGDAVTYSFDKSGVFPYFCLLHPGMVGAVVVGDGIPTSAASSGSGAKVVAAVNGGDAARGAPATTTPGTNGRTDITLIAGLALALAVAGAGGALLARRKAR